MKYPLWIQKNDTIGVTAPSSGIINPLKQKRLDYAIKNFRNLNFQILETSNTRQDKKGKSSSSKMQAKELESLIKNSKVKAIICATGGDFLNEMLDELNWTILKNNPKWIQGYSDPTSLLYILTTKYDIATIYSNNFGAFGMSKWHPSLIQNIDILKGKNVIQSPFPKYEKNGLELRIGNEEYNLDTKVKYHLLSKKQNEINISGRLIGGCLDCLLNICGTEYDATKEFLEKYKKDGFIWYLENAELSMESLRRELWQLKKSGWFQYVKAFLFGRSYSQKSYYGFTESQVIKETLKEFNVPIISNMDFGHVPPRMTLINGAIAHLKYQDEKITLEMEYKK